MKIVTLSYMDSDFRHCVDIRYQVFMLEQQVPAILEWDAADTGAAHVLVRQAYQPVACGRLLPSGYIGRMAVLPVWRGQGIGKRLCQHMLMQCRQHGWSTAKLSAQMHAIGFYQRNGFHVVSAPYPDAGILHVDMVCELL